MLSSSSSATTRHRHRGSLSLPLILGLSFLLCGKGVLGNNEVRIQSASDLIAFSKEVKSGTSYSGTTVFLDADIDFTAEESQEFEPIGTGSNSSFDGQGHTIKNLNLNSTLQHLGLFGYTTGTIIKNVVMDKSCSFTSHSNSNYPFVSGIIGQCKGINEPCALENNVNMASVTFSGHASNYTFIGGIAGQFYNENEQENIIRNCVNYGAVTFSGYSGDSFMLGGIIGEYYGKNIVNCINYGTTTNSGTTGESFQIGGIAGKTWNTTIENCLSAGRIESSTGLVGSIIGYSQDGHNTSITHSFWTSETGFTSSIGGGTPSSTNSYQTDLNSGVVEEMNRYASENDHSLNRWLLNTNKKTVTFIVNGEEVLSLTSQMVLFPDIAVESGLTFKGWYSDPNCSNEFTSPEVSEDTTLYAKLIQMDCVITFNTRGGDSDVQPITSPYRSTVRLLSNLTKNGGAWGISFWEDENGERLSWDFIVPSRNVTVYAVWLYLYIRDADELISFPKSVNSGTSYSGTTVFLNSDIDFTAEQSQQFEPIGNETNFFNGTFDGQGHVISNLNLDSTRRYVGLFGNTIEATIRNVVVDESCSFVSRFKSNSYYTYAGSITSFCNPASGPCVLENNVNMASVTFSGNAEGYTFIGGIVGQFVNENEQESAIRNCINYGAVTFSGYSGDSFMLGGIIGEYYLGHIVNCLNYGTITNSGTTGEYAHIGGITGKTWNVTIENCLSAGRIVSRNVGEIGAIWGYVQSGYIGNITHSFWTNETGRTQPAGAGDYSAKDLYQTELNSSVMEEMNRYASEIGPSCGWIVLHLNCGRINNLNQESLIVTQSHFPEPVKEGYTFLFWCKDAECSEEYEPNMTGVTDLYAKYIPNNYTVTFVSDGQTIQSKSLAWGSNIPYPSDPVKKGHTFTGWDSNPATVPESDITITATFKINKYTVTFDFDNGTAIGVEYEYNAPIEYPRDVERKGYIFVRWNDTAFEFMPDHDIITKAIWNETTQFVEIVFDTKDMSKEQIENIIKEIIGEDKADFVIEGFNVDNDTGETKVIIKFTDTEKAENFVETIKNSSSIGGKKITDINYVPNSSISLAACFSPLPYFYFPIL